MDTRNLSSLEVKKLRSLLKVSSNVPTHTPRSFDDMFWLYDDGVTKKLYVWFNGAWVAFSQD